MKTPVEEFASVLQQLTEKVRELELRGCRPGRARPIGGSARREPLVPRRCLVIRTARRGLSQEQPVATGRSWPTADVANRSDCTLRRASCIVLQTPRIEIFPFRFCDPITGKRVRARYVAKRHVIAEQYKEWEITGPPEIRDVDPNEDYFNPWRNPRVGKAPVNEPPLNKPPAEKDPPPKAPPVKEPKQIGAPYEHEPQLDEIERFFVLLFLRRYVTYCARRVRFVQMNGAAQLHREVAVARQR